MDERKDENYIPVGINAGGINSSSTRCNLLISFYSLINSNLTAQRTSPCNFDYFLRNQDVTKTYSLRRTRLKLRTKISRVMRKHDFCICEHKDADQLRGYRTADQRLCFRYILVPMIQRKMLQCNNCYILIFVTPVVKIRIGLIRKIPT